MKLSCNGHNPFLEQAALWAVVLQHEDTPEHRLGFATWLLLAPEHVEAALLFAAAVQEAEVQKAARQNPKLLAVIACSDPVEHQARATVTRGQPVSTKRRSRRRTAIAAVAAVGVGLLAHALFVPRPHHIEVPGNSTPAPIAVQRDQVIDSPGFVWLAPGSLLRVGDHSSVRVHVVPDGGGQEVTVLQGIAYFSGPHTPSQLLLVFSGRVAIVPVGTDFSVKNEDGQTEIAVSSGKVTFTCPKSPDGLQPIPVSPDEIAHLPSNDCSKPAQIGPLVPMSTAVESSREEGWLVFTDTPLKDAAEMFNRTDTHYLFVVDKAVATKRIGGHFQIADVDTFLRALEEFGVRAIRQGSSPDGVVIHLVQARQYPTRARNDTIALHQK